MKACLLLMKAARTTNRFFYNYNVLFYIATQPTQPSCISGSMIDVLLSTYNGEAHLRPQIDSILGQSFTDLRVLVRDDGSTDGTAAILMEYAERDERISVVSDYAGNLGAFSSFMKLTEYSTAPYFLFADQDDVWLPNKVELLIKRGREIEIENGSDIPVVVFSDLTIVDEELNVIDPSLWHFQQFDPNISRDWRSLLAQNVVLGCAMLANACAREKSLPYSLPDMPHDQWVALTAAKNGRIDFIREATILYRQHGNNYSGANQFDFHYALSRIPNFLNTIRVYHQAASLFRDVSTLELIRRKIMLNLRRFDRREEF
jgi:glycosyltransferase involved in cell wall biosynthesis